MKKAAYLFLVPIFILNGCHSNTASVNSAANATSNDTSKVAGVQQPVDTSVKKDGEVIRRYPNGVIKERSFYVGGRRRGECQSFYPNGKLWSDDYFTDGVLDGVTTSYFDGGQKRYEGVYSKGKPAGVWKFYNMNGGLVRTIDYDKTQKKPAM